MKIALMGFGTVGTGVEEILYKKKDNLLKNNFDIKIEKVLIKNVNKKRNPWNKDLIFTDNFDEILNSDVDAVIDATSSVDETYNRIISLMKSGKNIITANKAVVSKHFEELNELAKENDIYFSYEASVAAAIPIIHPITEELPFNKIKEICGILNGTSNYILSKMEKENLDYKEVLKEAQALGYAESDPTADIEGLDSMRKIRILSSLFYNAQINEEEIFTFGISNIKKSDLDFIKKEGYFIRLIAKSKLIDNKINIFVMPTLLNDDFFTKTFDSTNAIKVFGDNFGEYELKGAGAGKLETADAIMRDLLRILSKREIKTFYNNENNFDVSKKFTGKYYIRTSEISDILKDIIAKDNLIEKDHHIITKEVSLFQISEIVKNYTEEIFIAKVKEIWNFYLQEIQI